MKKVIVRMIGMAEFTKLSQVLRKKFFFWSCDFLDCFASLAMTVIKRNRNAVIARSGATKQSSQFGSHRFCNSLVLCVSVALLCVGLGCDGNGRSVDWEGNVDGFLGRINETPGSGGGVVAVPKVTVSSIGTGATGSGNYVVGQTVFINAGTKPETWLFFDRWTTRSKGVTFADSAKASTSFTMPANDVTVTAVFDTTEFEVTVDAGVGATGSGKYKVGSNVKVYAGTVPAGWILAGWTGTGKSLSDPKNVNYSFIMPNNSVNLKANFAVIPTPSISTFIDIRDNTTYKKVSINGKMWMAENLNYQTASGSWCYDNNSSNCNTYGRLYTWETAKTVCPGGWHLPSSEEWNVLVNEAGGNMAGSRLKATSGWNRNGNGTDEYGFSALSGGYRHPDGSFNNAGNSGDWWTATGGEGDWSAYHRDMYFDYGIVGGGSDVKSGGNSVRCVAN